MIVEKGFKYRFFPTDEQSQQLARTFGCARYVYNQALELRTQAWQQEKKSVGYHETAAKLTEWKKEPDRAFLSEVSSVVHPSRTWVTYVTDQLWNPSPKPNVVNETRANTNLDSPFQPELR